MTISAGLALLASQKAIKEVKKSDLSDKVFFRRFKPREF
jgi:hypothetical protein